MNEFDYKIISKNSVTVITFTGKLNKESREQLEACRQQITEDASTMLVIYFKEVSAVDPCVFREFTMLQQEIRKRNVELYLAGLNNSTRQYLVDKGVIRNSEVRKSLIEVFEDKKKVAA